MGKVYTVDGFTGTLKEIAIRFNIRYGTLCDRLQRGLALDEAISYNKIKTYTVDGFTGTLHEIAEYFSVEYQTLRYRLNKGLSMEESISVERYQQQGHKYTVNGFTGSLNEIAKHFGIPYCTIYSRLKSGLSIEESIGVKRYKHRGHKYTVDGFTGSIKEISEHFCVPYYAIYSRLKSGRTIEESTIGFKKANKGHSGRKPEIHTTNGYTGSIKEISEHFNINLLTLRTWLGRGLSLDEAVIKLKYSKYNLEEVMDKKYENIELVNINMKMPRGLYNKFKLQSDVEDKTLTDIFMEIYQSPRINGLKFDVIGDEISGDFVERISKFSSDMRESSEEHFNLFIKKLYLIIKLDNSLEVFNKSSETTELIDMVYPDFGTVDKTRLLKLFSCDDECFNNLLEITIAKISH